MKTQKLRPISAPDLSRPEIISRADVLSRRFSAIKTVEWILQNGYFFNDLYEHVIYPDYEIEIVENARLGVASDGLKILGQYGPVESCALLDETIGVRSGDRRRVFTIYHEVGGHGILHGEWLRSQLLDGRRAGSLVTTNATLTGGVHGRLERQANLFAAHLAAPRWLLRIVMKKLFDLRNPYRYTGPGTYGMWCGRSDVKVRIDTFDELCRFMASKIRHRFGCLSAEALGYGIKECGLVVDCTRRRMRLRRVGARADHARLRKSNSGFALCRLAAS